jgi:hypothetical protein
MSAQKRTSLVRTLPQRGSPGSRISSGLASTFLMRRAAHLSQPPTKRASGYQPATAVGGFLPKLTKKAFEKYGFSTTTLIMEWAAIAGSDIASATLPEKLKWPRAMGDQTKDDATNHEGAVLVLRVDPARALDISYRERQIIDRINAHFGYRAIAALRLVQAPLAVPHMTKPQTATRHVEVQNSSSADPLSDALGRLGEGLKRQAATGRGNLSSN